MTKEQLAGMMYHSLKKLTALANDVIMYPAHGPGSPQNPKTPLKRNIWLINFFILN
jgi:glyoxylase-like metal-dependent hydrolase (beta-lactamase superfamily II)